MSRLDGGPEEYHYGHSAWSFPSGTPREVGLGVRIVPLFRVLPGRADSGLLFTTLQNKARTRPRRVLVTPVVRQGVPGSGREGTLVREGSTPDPERNNSLENPKTSSCLPGPNRLSSVPSRNLVDSLQLFIKSFILYRTPKTNHPTQRNYDFPNKDRPSPKKR